MDDTEEIYISTETNRLHDVRHAGLVIFLTLTLIIVVASLVTAFSQA